MFPNRLCGGRFLVLFLTLCLLPGVLPDEAWSGHLTPAQSREVVRKAEKSRDPKVVQQGAYEARYLRDYAKAAQLFEKAFGLGYFNAGWELAELYWRKDTPQHNRQKAVAWYRKLAEHPVPVYADNKALLASIGSIGPSSATIRRAQLRMAVILAHGWSVPKDRGKAIAWLKALFQEVEGADNIYAAVHSLFDNPDDKRSEGHFFWGLGYLALQLLEDGAAERGVMLLTYGAEQKNPGNMRQLGLVYRQGKAVKRDEGKAFELMNAAVQAGDASAMLILGNMYEKGPQAVFNATKAYKRDWQKARTWYRKAVAQKVPGAQGLLENLEQKIAIKEKNKSQQAAIAARGPHPDQVPELTGLAKERSAQELYVEGASYYEGKGVAKNYEKALVALTWAARKNHPGAQYYLGRMFEHGHLVKKDPAEAYRWFKKAADQGLAQSQFFVAAMNWQGLGTKQNKDAALTWMLRSAEQGFPDAMFQIGSFYYQGTDSTPSDPGKALQWWRKAAEKGFAEAQFNLGVGYAKGRLGLPRDPDQAKFWLTKAAEQGHARARAALQ